MWGSCDVPKKIGCDAVVKEIGRRMVGSTICGTVTLVGPQAEEYELRCDTWDNG